MSSDRAWYSRSAQAERCITAGSSSRKEEQKYKHKKGMGLCFALWQTSSRRYGESVSKPTAEQLLPLLQWLIYGQGVFVVLSAEV